MFTDSFSRRCLCTSCVQQHCCQNHFFFLHFFSLLKNSGAASCNFYVVHMTMHVLSHVEALCRLCRSQRHSNIFQALLICDVSIPCYLTCFLLITAVVLMPCCLTGSLLITAVEAALRIPQQLPTSKPLRARFISFLHRMVGHLTFAV